MDEWIWSSNYYLLYATNAVREIDVVKCKSVDVGGVL